MATTPCGWRLEGRMNLGDDDDDGNYGYRRREHHKDTGFEHA